MHKPLKALDMTSFRTIVRSANQVVLHVHGTLYDMFLCTPFALTMASNVVCDPLCIANLHLLIPFSAVFINLVFAKPF